MKYNKIEMISILILTVFTLSACSSASPRCNDEDVKKAVIERLLINTLNNQKTDLAKMKGLINLRLENVRVIEEDSKSKQCICEANIKYIAYEQPYIVWMEKRYMPHKQDFEDVQKQQANDGPFNDNEIAKLKKAELSQEIKYKVQKAVDTGSLWVAANVSKLDGTILIFSREDQVLKLE